MEWSMIIPIAAFLFVLIGEIFRAHMLIRRLEKRVDSLEKASSQDYPSNKKKDIS